MPKLSLFYGFTHGALRCVRHAGEMTVDWISSCPDATSTAMYADNPAHKNSSAAKVSHCRRQDIT